MTHLLLKLQTPNYIPSCFTLLKAQTGILQCYFRLNCTNNREPESNTVAANTSSQIYF